MNEWEYLESKKKLPYLRHAVEHNFYDKSNFKKDFSNFIEALITVKGHAWCMDVKAERRKMANLITQAIIELISE